MFLNVGVVKLEKVSYQGKTLGTRRETRFSYVYLEKKQEEDREEGKENKQLHFDL